MLSLVIFASLCADVALEAPADAPAPSIFEASFAPRDGAANVPRNARLFTDHPSSFFVSSTGGDGFSMFGPDFLGQPLQLVENQANSVAVTDDFTAQERTVTFNVGAGDDQAPPTAPTIRGARTEGQRVIIGILRATDDRGVALYVVDDTVSGTRSALFDDGAAGELEAQIGVFVPGPDPELRTFNVTAVDLAGNVSASDSVDVLCEPTPQQQQPLPPFGCASTSAAPFTLALFALAAVRRRHRR